MGLSLYSYETYISNDFSKLKKAKIRSIRAKVKPRHYLPNLILGQIYNERFIAETYPLILSLIRRTRFLIKDYNSLTLKLKGFDPLKRKINLYFDIIYKAEITILFCGQVIEIFNILSSKQLFKKNDGSVYDRIYNLHNQIKHIKEEIKDKKQIQVLKFDDDGIYTTKFSITYDELREFIVSLKNVTEKSMKINT